MTTMLHDVSLHTYCQTKRVILDPIHLFKEAVDGACDVCMFVCMSYCVGNIMCMYVSM